MNKLILILIYLFQLPVLKSCGQSHQSVPENFLNLLNRYEKDSLKIITSDNFQLEEGYVHRSINKAEFIDSFVTFSKVVNGKFNIVKKVTESEPFVFLVEDISDYIKYFDLKAPTWKLTIVTNKDKVSKMTSDTTKGYQAYLNKFLIKHNNFIKWLNSKYPNETEDYLYHNINGLLHRRLKEFSSIQ